METTLKRKYKSLIDSKEEFIQNNELIKNFSLSNRGKIKEIFKNGNIDEIETYVTLCPFYDKTTGGIKGDYKDFSQVGERYQKKLEASLEVINFLSKTFKLKINFLLADRGILVSNNYDTNNLDKDLDGIVDLYKEKIKTVLDSFEITTFSNLGINIPQLCNLGETKTKEEIIQVLDSFGVDRERFRYSLDIIKEAFGNTGAYYLIQNYLIENKELLEKFENIIFINTEAVSPLNSLYTAGENKLTSKNLFARVDI